jgi:hypothetical protein
MPYGINTSWRSATSVLEEYGQKAKKDDAIYVAKRMRKSNMNKIPNRIEDPFYREYYNYEESFEIIDSANKVLNKISNKEYQKKKQDINKTIKNLDESTKTCTSKATECFKSPNKMNPELNKSNLIDQIILESKKITNVISTEIKLNADVASRKQQEKIGKLKDEKNPPKLNVLDTRDLENTLSYVQEVGKFYDQSNDKMNIRKEEDSEKKKHQNSQKRKAFLSEMC